jgi:hypothetical protein
MHRIAQAKAALEPPTPPAFVPPPVAVTAGATSRPISSKPITPAVSVKSQEPKSESAKPKTIMNFFNPSTKDKEKEVSKKEGNIPSSSSAASGVTTSTSNNITTGAVVVASAAAVAASAANVTSGKSNISTTHTSLSAALANPPSAMVTPAPPAAKTVQPSPPQQPPTVPPSGSIHTGSVSETVPSHIFEPVLSPAQTRLAKLLEHGMPIIKHGN